MYYKNHIPLVRRSDLTRLDECLISEIHCGNKKVFISTLYRSPSQSADQFDLFKDRLEETVQGINDTSPHMSLLLGDFNARNSDWWDKDISNTHGLQLSDLMLQNGMHQIIDEPTHILPNSSSCIDLIFSSVPGYISEHGVLPSLFPTCHHQLVFAKIDFKIFFPPPYQRRIWDYPKADVESIKRAVNLIDWDLKFASLDVNERVEFLTNSIVNICSNFIPNRIITVRNKDAPWITPEIKAVLRMKTRVYRRYVKKGRTLHDLHELNLLRSRSKQLINEAKERYEKKLTASLSTAGTGSKRYWSIINRLLNKRKIPQIPPLRVNNEVISDTLKKADLFNKYFAEKCTVVNTDSVLPCQRILTDTTIGNVHFDDQKIITIIRTLNVDKAHGWDNVSVRMIRICDDTLVKPLLNIFRCSLESSTFPTS